MMESPQAEMGKVLCRASLWEKISSVLNRLSLRALLGIQVMISSRLIDRGLEFS